ncbi:hypothetical protein DDZ18_07935 [Marinicauda salina]|uniref:Stringent starvation protein B n=2 Tax=Marinicauda salina TaxID=2135793 RepID=A0A2U2BV20_9PROT|nr:hypothetical protein DDZ18_07935 [Marinicauda salina]
MQYDKLAQQALRQVVREALMRAANKGLPGAHHFFISFKTRDPDCDLDESLLKAYPDEMTIVLEHQFWDLGADDDGFEVTLKFDGVPKYLRVPWRAITRFHDPAVNFHLPFDYEEPEKPAVGKDRRKTAASDDAAVGDDDEHTVVSLDAFRKKE